MPALPSNGLYLKFIQMWRVRLLGIDHNFLVPDFFFPEVGNVLWKRVRRGDDTADNARQTLADLNTVPILRSCTFSIRIRWAVPTLRNHKLFGLWFSQQDGGARCEYRGVFISAVDASCFKYRVADRSGSLWQPLFGICYYAKMPDGHSRRETVQFFENQ